MTYLFGLPSNLFSSAAFAGAVVGQFERAAWEAECIHQYRCRIGKVTLKQADRGV